MRVYANELIALVTVVISTGVLILAAAIACDLVSLDLVERLQ